MAEATQGITRRQALKRGLVIGTGVVWATPAVQAIRISEAYAQTTSPGNGGGGGNGGDTTTTTTVPDVSGGTIQPPGNGSGGGGNGIIPDEVGGKVVVQQPGAPSAGPGGAAAQAPVTEVEAETLPLTGMDVFPLAGLGGGLLAAGAASLKIAKQIPGSDADEPSPAAEGD